jgi:hypothetical protein
MYSFTGIVQRTKIFNKIILNYIRKTSSNSEQILNKIYLLFKQQIVINEFFLLLKFTALTIKEIILLAFILNFIDFYEEYKLRPESYINQF